VTAAQLDDVTARTHLWQREMIHEQKRTGAGSRRSVATTDLVCGAHRADRPACGGATSTFSNSVSWTRKEKGLWTGPTIRHTMTFNVTRKIDTGDTSDEGLEGKTESV
jgi:hypothetical protein